MSAQEYSIPAGLYTIENVHTDTVLDSYYGKSDEGNPVNGSQPHGGSNQQWQLEWTGTSPKFELCNVKTNCKSYLSYGHARNSDRVVTSKMPNPCFILVADKCYA
ncbi:unnamed protein product [Rhizoctonia solani]|uniref:Ricin B lectin domain-containing protein n=1 Tax=Rhizoctonia solani TaxID=456999 RepID=A0A8H2Y2Q1_9AGAM|nr:unnamed protein product [Rhizoctonia solani]